MGGLYRVDKMRIIFMVFVAVPLVYLTVKLVKSIIEVFDVSYVKEQINNTYQFVNEQYNERRLKRDVRKYSRNVSIKMSFIDKIELLLIDKSNVRQYIPFMSFHILVAISAVIFTVSFYITFSYLKYIPSAIILSCIAAIMPAIVLDIMCKINADVTRKKLAFFVSVLLKWVTVKEDIFYAFEKSIDSGIGEPLRSHVQAMIIQVRKGMDPLVAFDILMMKVDNDQFRDFMVNIKQNYRARGDTVKLLNIMEEQFYKLEEEHNARNITTYQDRIILMVIMIVVIVVIYLSLRYSPSLRFFYLGTDSGKVLLTIFACMYLIGFFFYTKINKFDH